MKPVRMAVYPTDPVQNKGFGYSPENEPDFRKFEAGLDAFSRSLGRDSWFQTAHLVPPNPGPWNATQRQLFRNALQRVRAALAVTPYKTVLYLFHLKEMAAEHADLSNDFWVPLGEACDGRDETTEQTATTE